MPSKKPSGRGYSRSEFFMTQRAMSDSRYDKARLMSMAKRERKVRKQMGKVAYEPYIDFYTKCSCSCRDCGPIPSIRYDYIDPVRTLNERKAKANAERRKSKLRNGRTFP